MNTWINLNNITIFIILLFLISCDVHHKQSIYLFEYELPALVDSVIVKSGVDFKTGQLITENDTFNFYYGSYPDLLTEVTSLIIDYPEFAISFESENEIEKINFVKKISEPNREWKEKVKNINSIKGLVQDFPPVKWDTLSLYQLNKKTHSIWASIPRVNGTSEIVVFDSTLTYHSKNSLPNGKLHYPVLAIYINSVSITDSTEIFNFIKEIKKTTYNNGYKSCGE